MTIEHGALLSVSMLHGDYTDYAVECSTCETPQIYFYSKKPLPLFLGGRLELVEAERIAKLHESTYGTNHQLFIQPQIQNSYEEGRSRFTFG